MHMEGERDHRFEMDRAVLKMERLGQYLAAGLAMAGIAGGVTFAALGAPWAGAVVGVIVPLSVLLRGVFKVRHGDSGLELDTRAQSPPAAPEDTNERGPQATTTDDG